MLVLVCAFDFVYACRRFNNWTSINSKSIQQAVKEIYRETIENDEGSVVK